MSRNLNVDLLRIVSCVSIIGLHTLETVGSLSCFAIPAFFMISGFFSLRKEKIDVAYLNGKILRIFKLVILWSLLWLSFPNIFIRSPGWSNPWHICLFNTIQDSLVQRAIWQFWYLGALILVYLTLPGILLLKRKYGWKMLIAIWALLFTFGLAMQLTSMFLHMPTQKTYTQTFRMWTWLQYVLFGGMFFQYQNILLERISFRVNLLLLILLTETVFVWQYLVGTYVIYDTHAEYYYDDILIFLYTISICMLIMRLHLPNKISGLIRTLAPLTLGVYIIHPFIIDWLTKYMRVYTAAEHCLCFIVVTGVTFTIVYCISKIPIFRQFVIL